MLSVIFIWISVLIIPIQITEKYSIELCSQVLCSNTDKERGKQKLGKNRGTLEPDLCSRSTGGSNRARALMEGITGKICRSKKQETNRKNSSNVSIPSSTLKKPTKTTTIKTSTATLTTASNTERYNGNTKPPEEELSNLKNLILNSDADFKKILTKIATTLKKKASASSTTSSTTRSSPTPTTKQPTRGRSPKAENSLELGRVRTDNVKITWFKPPTSPNRRKSVHRDTFS